MIGYFYMFSYHSSLFTFCSHKCFEINFIFHIFIHKDITEVISFFCVRNRKTIFIRKDFPNLPNDTPWYHPAISFSKSCKQTRWTVCKQQNDKIYLMVLFEEILLVSHVSRSKHFEGSLLRGIVVWNPHSL